MLWFTKIYFGYVDKYTKTGLLHQYLNYLYHSHIESYDAEPWIREGFLDEEFDPILYPTLSLAQLLQNTSEIPDDCSGTLVLQGSNGDGRVFSLYKIMACCLKHIPSHVTWEDVQSDKKFRFPIFVTTEDIQQWNDRIYENTDDAILSLLCASIERQLEVTEKPARSYIQEVVREILSSRKACVFFKHKLSKDKTIADKLINALHRMKNRTLSIFIEDKEFSPSDPTLLHCIDFGPVKENQIAEFLSVMLEESKDDWMAKLKSRPDIVRILNKPERLLVYVKSAEKQDTNAKKADIALNSIYDAFIQNEIASAVNHAAEHKLKVTAKDLMDWLLEYCENFTDSEGKYDLFQETDMFNEDGTFKFEDCRYYLIAKKQKLKSDTSNADIRKAIQSILQTDYPAKTLAFCSCFLKKSTQKFKFFFNQLIDELKSHNLKDRNLSDAALLADIMCASDSFEIVGNIFFKWAASKLDIHTYDNSVLDAIAHLSDVFGSGRVAEKLMVQFTDSKASKRKQRRIAYYFSYAKRGVPSALIDFFQDLDAQDPEARHLKYHIIDAFIDNYNLLEVDPADQLTIFTNHLDNDCILKSEYDAVHLRIHNSRWLSSHDAFFLNELIGILSTGEYWEKAHVAGALSRHAYSSDEEANSAVEGMFRVLAQELEALSNPDEANINHTRVVSYIVKSYCRLGRRIPSLNRTIHKKLVGLLERYIKVLHIQDVSVSVYFSLQTALSVVMEGILCLSDTKRELRRNLGKYYTMDEPLLSAYDDMNRLDREILGNQGSHIEESILSMEERIRAPGLAMDYMIDSLNLDWSDISRWSLIRIKCENWGPFYGFLIAYNRSLYAITCRHNFYNMSMQKYADVSTASFSLTCYSMDSFTGSLQYPPQIDFTSSFDANPNEDIVIFRLHRVPIWLYKAVFSLDNLTGAVKGAPGHSITFGEEGTSVPVKTKSGTIDQSQNNGFFNITIPTKEETRGFSGVAVFGNHTELYGMWKGSEGNTLKRCIDSRVILNRLKAIEERRI